MAQTFESLYTSTLSKKLESTDVTMTVATPPTVTAGRIHLKRGGVEELISFTGVSGSILTGLTRGLSLTADPTTGGTGETWVAGTVIELVAMHDQLLDKDQFTELKQVGLTFADTTARDAALGGDGVATLAYTDIYVTADGLFYNYNLSTAQWEALDTGTATPNASDGVAGKVDGSNQTLVDAGTELGSSSAPNNVNPLTLGRAIQKQAYTHDVDTGVADAYIITLTPAPVAYVDGMRFSVEISNNNTGASTLKPNTLAAKSIVDRDGDTLVPDQLVAGQVYIIQYELTNDRFVLMTISKASDAEALAGVNDTKYVTSAQTILKTDTIVLTRINTVATGTVQYAHGLGKVPKLITFHAIDATNQWSNGSFDGTTDTAVYATGTPGAAVSSAFSIRTNSASGSAFQTGVVSASTSTTFDITWTKTGSPTNTTFVQVSLIA